METKSDEEGSFDLNRCMVVVLHQQMQLKSCRWGAGQGREHRTTLFDLWCHKTLEFNCIRLVIEGRQF